MDVPPSSSSSSSTTTSAQIVHVMNNNNDAAAAAAACVSPCPDPRLKLLDARIQEAKKSAMRVAEGDCSTAASLSPKITSELTARFCRVQKSLCQRGYAGVFVEVGGQVGCGKSTALELLHDLTGQEFMREKMADEESSAEFMRVFYAGGPVTRASLEMAHMLANVNVFYSFLSSLDAKVDREPQLVFADRGLRSVRGFMSVYQPDDAGDGKATGVMLHHALESALATQRHHLARRRYADVSVFLHLDEVMCDLRRFVRADTNDSALRRAEAECLCRDECGLSLNANLLKAAESDYDHILHLDPMAAPHQVLLAVLDRLGEAVQTLPTLCHPPEGTRASQQSKKKATGRIVVEKSGRTAICCHGDARRGKNHQYERGYEREDDEDDDDDDVVEKKKEERDGPAVIVEAVQTTEYVQIDIDENDAVVAPADQ